MRELRRLHELASLLDSAFQIPGTSFRIGWDSLVGLVPGIGDAMTGVLSAAIVARAAQLGVPRGVLTRMGLNVAVDVIVGAVPLIGDVFDVVWKANKRNVRLLERYLERAERLNPAQPARRVPVTHQ
jgi:hypothetical protein